MGNDCPLGIGLTCCCCCCSKSVFFSVGVCFLQQGVVGGYHMKLHVLYSL